MPMQVNIRTQVNSKSIRREQHNGRDHIVIPSYTMPFDVVMNGGLSVSYTHLTLPTSDLV